MWMLMLMLRQSKLPLRPRLHARIILVLMYPVLMQSPAAQGNHSKVGIRGEREHMVLVLSSVQGQRDQMRMGGEVQEYGNAVGFW